MIYHNVVRIATILLLVGPSFCTLVELGAEFGDMEKLEQAHLVMFYAPWCGHCRSLHPIWHELSSKLSRHPVTVAKIDATLYRTAAEKFNVKGFPSIRLVATDRVIEYTGDRTTSSLFDFATKGARPLLPSVGSLGKLNDLKKSEDVIFLAKGITEEIRNCLKSMAPSIVHETIIAEATNDVAIRVDKEMKSIRVNEETVLRSDLSVSKSPGIVVSKDDKVFEFSGNISNCIELKQWVLSERFSAFQVGSYPVIHPLLFLKYKIVFYYGPEEARVQEMKNIAAQREQLSDDFYFIHVDKAEYIENLISSYAEEDTVLVYDPISEMYSYSTGPSKSIRASIDEHTSGKAVLYGGTSMWANCKKVGYRIHSNIWPLFVDHPFIMGLVIMIPIGLLALCCCDEQRSKDDPIRHIQEDESQMDLLWGDEKVTKEIEDTEEKDPDLKKDE